ncbi:MAG: efflux RND transporter periplasmic adaptor subunit [Pirellula sp.]
MLKSLIGSALLLATVVGIAYFIAKQKHLMMSAPPPPNQEQPVMVVFASAEPITLRQSATAVGTILAPRSLQLRTEVVGTVEKITFKSGDKVTQNQVLLKLDTSVEEAQLLSATAAKKMAESARDRTEKAASVKAISELEVEQVIALAVQAQAEVMRLEALIRKKTLRAPFNARAGLFDVHVGQYLPEGTQITMLQGLDDFVHVDFMMPQQVADHVTVDDEIQILIEPKAAVAKIVAIDTQADRITRNVSARAKLVNPPEHLQPNDSVRVGIEYGPSRPAVTIPASGLRRSPAEAFVYLVKPDPEEPSKLRAYARTVKPGSTVGQGVAIMYGIEPGTTIVSDGSFKIHEKAWVVQAEAVAPSVSKAAAKVDSSHDAETAP